MNVKFIGSFDRVDAMPSGKMSEYAFVGRSNVGKSSLLNALTGHKIARTSNTPGRTQLINLFEWNIAANGADDNIIMLADLPGYGYARASKVDIEHWQKRLVKYLQTRAQLECLFILVDARHGLKDSDLDMMELCDECAIPYQVIMTKVDKTNKVESEKRKVEIETEIKKHGAARPNVIITSADKKWGIEELREELRNRN